MSKINAIRLVNINYNHNAIHISDETLRFNGRSTLISLQNGGGKSVLVQLLTAPFVQKRYRNLNERSFASYFTTPRPSFIMVEWALENGAGYCLTGMMVRKSQNMDNNDELELINFISEYSEPCEQDINHLPVVENSAKEIRLKSFAACRALFEEYKKQKLNEFFCFDMNNYAQSKQYFNKLAEYGIDYREWQNIIKKINEEESGLSKLFAECKDEKGLLEKWFLDAVENKLNKDKNRMQEFRNILEKYISIYSENYNKIQRQEKLDLFRQEATPISEQGKAFEECSTDVLARLAKIYECIAELNRLAGLNKEASENCQSELEELGKQFVRLLHEEYSSDFYCNESKKEGLLAVKQEHTEQKQQLEEQAASIEKQQHILECANLQERLNDDERDLQRAEQRVVVLRQKNKELEPERAYIGYLLKQYTEQELKDKHEACKQREDEKSACLAMQQENKRKMQQLLNELNELHNTQGQLEAAISAYDDVEESYNKKWLSGAGALQRNMLGEYEAAALSIMAQKLASDEQNAKLKQQNMQQNQHRLKEELVGLERGLQECLNDKQAKEMLLSKRVEFKKQLDEQLAKRRTLLQYLHLDEQLLFDKARIQKELSQKLLEMDAAKDKLIRKLTDVQKRYQGLQTGKTLELSAELVQMLEHLGINIVYGFQWLKENNYDEAQNLALVKQHPFLPYALLMTAKEVAELQRAEKNIYTSFPVPIILRESLTQDTKSSVDNGIFKGNDVSFLMLFNDKLLNEDKLQRMLAELQQELQEIEQSLAQRKQEYDFYRAKYGELEEQSFTKESYARLGEELLALQEQIAEKQREIADINDKKSQNAQEQEQLAAAIAEAGKLIDKLQQQQADLQQLEAKYKQYLFANERLQECQKHLADAEAGQKRLAKELDELQSRLQLCTQYLMELNIEINGLNKELAQYASYKQAGRPNNFDASLEQDPAALKIRLESILQKLSGELRMLEDNVATVARRVQKSQKDLRERAKRFNLVSEEWLAERYSYVKMQELDDKKQQAVDELKQVEDKLLKIEIELTEVQAEQKNVLKRMEEKCFVNQPLPKDELLEKDFEEAKNTLAYASKQKEEQKKSLAEQEQNIKENLAVLVEFSDGAESAVWSEDFKLEDFSQEELYAYTASLKKAYKNSQEQEAAAQRKLVQALNRLTNSDAFQDDFYKRRIDVLLGLTNDALTFMQQLTAVLQSFVSISEKLQADIAIVEQEKAHIITLLEDYVQSVHKQLGQIDRNSTIKIRGNNVKMLKLNLPEWEENANIYHLHVTDMVDMIAQRGLEKLRKNEPINELLGKLLTTKELYDAVIGINNVHVQMFKVEAQREVQISWRDVARNSGGEGFLSAFVILSSLLYYMRRDETDVFADRNEGKVLLMDNPFAQTNAAHLLTPLMDMAAKNNTQLISFTGLGGESIYNCYDNIYVLNLIPSKLSSVSHLKSKHIAGSEGDLLSLARVEVVDDGDMQSLF